MQPPPAGMDPARMESDLWDAVKDSGNEAALNSYLAKYSGRDFRRRRQGADRGVEQASAARR